ncbi:PREDICTED: DNA mismatch repair protein Mlh1 [Ceratosolen solmsi marchali]|uniref:DNA mismatch repair protein Mlh1 n=1 Tax=Ceratosolen solmsi marchali TaxID=326594 RepID=A0AAJ6YEM4_9HYME|nr:PREDICTED: DNA mismatch repair protein Mlh1 [Ceratosolen solmsi marchali]
MTIPGRIRKLDESVINRIAAGEIIQRPANALKELIENSLDAKSTNIQIWAKEGGLKLLQIQDNGTGIRVADLAIVCERFTTSKLQDFDDLQSISTYGFRGEALASISHIAQLTITTKTINEKCAYRASYIDSKLKGPPVPCAGNQGTIITIENLFYNVETRRKALSTYTEEFVKILDVVNKYAIHNPNVGFTLKKHGELVTQIRTPQSSTKINNIRLLYGNNIVKELLEVELDDHVYKFKLHALITNANYSSKRLTLLLFINHRLVDSNPLKKTIEDLYTVYLPKKSHPWCYISLEIDSQNIDVNVHPTKHEVRFLYEDIIIEKIKNTLDEKLTSNNSSRTFYIQAKLPKVDITKEIMQEALPDTQNESSKMKKIQPKDMIRTCSSDQKLDKFNFTSSFINKYSITSINKEDRLNTNIEDAEDIGIQNTHGTDIEDAQDIGIQDTQNINMDDSQTINIEETQDSSIEDTEYNRLEETQDMNIEDAQDIVIQDTQDLKIKDKHDIDISKDTEAYIDDSDFSNDSNITVETKDICRSVSAENDDSDMQKDSNESFKSNSSCSALEENENSDTCSKKSRQPIDFKSYSVNEVRIETKLLSVLTLRKEIEDTYHEGLRDILSNLIFIGCIDECSALIQSGINLYICNTQKLAEELFYEIMLYDFANYGVIKFSEPLLIQDLAILGLECEEAGWSESIGDKKDLAMRVQELLLEKSDMLRQYFSICIDKKGYLKSLPILLENYIPSQGEIPLYLLRLSTEVNWTKEKPCFNDVCRETAKFYSKVDITNDSWKNITENILYNAIKESLLPPKHFSYDSTILEITSLPSLYKVFERC